MFYTVLAMKPYKPPQRSLASYAACRHGGAPPGLVAVELELPGPIAARLERLFQQRPGAEGDAMKPRFARNADHVAAVNAAGGYPAIAVRRR
ncbi:MAG: hypothetical protein JSR98_11980 [Proteobacteria bacterium]|nr:hypothetical protein [Pseudomonadota bacterium]